MRVKTGKWRLGSRKKNRPIFSGAEAQSEAHAGWGHKGRA